MMNSKHQNKNIQLIQLQNDIKILLKQQQQYEAQGNHLEASKCNLQIKEKQNLLQEKIINELKLKHVKAFTDLDKALHQQLNHFNKFWDQKMNMYKKQAQKFQNDLELKQQKNTLMITEQIKSNIQKSYNYSQQLKNMINLQQKLVEQQKFIEAQNLQIKIKQATDKQMQGLQGKYFDQIAKQSQKLQQKYLNQKKLLNQRLFAGIDKIDEERRSQELKIKQKYAQVSKNLKQQHKQQFQNIVAKLNNYKNNS